MKRFFTEARFSTIFLLIIFTSSCSIVDGIGSARVVKDEVGFVYDASERLIYTYNNITCSEPPPDVLKDTLGEFATKLQIDTGSGIQAGGEIGYKLNENAEKIFSRSQTIQYFRDANHYLCQSLGNDPRKGEEKFKEYKSAMNELMRRVEFLLIASECSGNATQQDSCTRTLGELLSQYKTDS